MIRSNYKVLRVLSFLELKKWSVDQPLYHTANYKFKMTNLSTCLKRSKRTVQIDDNKVFTRITIKLYGQGVYVRDRVLGTDIGTKRQFLASHKQLILSSIDARNGAFGVVPKELDNAIVTNDFWLFDLIDCSGEYIKLLLSSHFFTKYWQNQSSGTTNRQRINEETFLNSLVPLPSLYEQEQLVTSYNNKIELANEYEEKAKSLEGQIDKLLFEELGIEFNNDFPSEKKIFRITSFASLGTKWINTLHEEEVFNPIKNSTYSPVTIGNYYNLVTRTWKKEAFPSKEFNYIEISSINPDDASITPTKLSVSKAPSRATQIVYEGDLILGLTRPYLKKFTIVTAKEHQDICSSAFQVIEKNPKYDLEYLRQVLKSAIGIKQFEILMTGALYPAINQEQLSAILIPLPPLDIQLQISSKITKMKSDIKEFRQKAQGLRTKAKQDFENEVFNVE